jgi:hypothetical protein
VRRRGDRHSDADEHADRYPHADEHANEYADADKYTHAFAQYNAAPDAHARAVADGVPDNGVHTNTDVDRQPDAYRYLCAAVVGDFRARLSITQDDRP